jgi:hypothetical protein
MNFKFIQKMDEAIEHALKHPDPRTTEQGTMTAAMG